MDEYAESRQAERGSSCSTATRARPRAGERRGARRSRVRRVPGAAATRRRARDTRADHDHGSARVRAARHLSCRASSRGSEHVDNNQVVFAEHFAPKVASSIPAGKDELFALLDDAIDDPRRPGIRPCRVPQPPGIARIAAGRRRAGLGPGERRDRPTMTADLATRRRAAGRRSSGAACSRPEWPLVVICAGMPFTFLLGIHSLVWVLPVVGVRRAARSCSVNRSSSRGRRCRCCSSSSGSRSRCCSSKPAQLPLAIYRWLVFVSPLAVLHLARQPLRVRGADDAGRATAVDAVGHRRSCSAYLAIALPELLDARARSSACFRARCSSNVYLRDLTAFQFAEVQELVRANGRSSGGADGVLERLGLDARLAHAVLRARLLHPRDRSAAAGPASPSPHRGWCPIIFSLNRGLWLSLAVAFALRRVPACAAGQRQGRTRGGSGSSS